MTVDKRAVILFDGSRGTRSGKAGPGRPRTAERFPLEEALEAQKAYWEAYWRTSDIRIEAADGERGNGGGGTAGHPLLQLPAGPDLQRRQHAPQHRRQGPDGRGLQRARLLGYGILLPALLPVHQPGGGPGSAPVPLQHAAHGPGAGEDAGLQGRLLSHRHAERRGGLLPVAACQPAAAAQHGGGLRHLALCAGDRGRGIPVALRRGNAAADRPLPGQPGGKGRPDGKVRLLRRHGPGRVPHDGEQQRLYQLHGQKDAGLRCGSAGTDAAGEAGGLGGPGGENRPAAGGERGTGGRSRRTCICPRPRAA